MGSTVVLGAGIGGLGAAIGLARAGHDVTVIERDPPPPDVGGDEAFLAWDRRHVPQFRQAHGFSARARNLLVERAPEVVGLLHADGIEESNYFKLLAPPELHTPEDERFTSLFSRRAAFELALRRAAQDMGSIRFRCPQAASSLCLSSDGPVPVVAGVTVGSGDLVEADVVIDALGRRSPVPGWLREYGIAVPEHIQPCELTYHTRYYRQTPQSELPQATLIAIRSDLAGLMLLGFPGDHRSFAITIAAPPWDEELKVLRHNWAFDAVASAIPSSATWVAAEQSTPLSDVDTMAGHANVRRHYVVGGAPLVGGLLAVGDSLCTTNPAYGWGASMALTYGFAAVDAIVAARDPIEAALLYDEAVGDEADAVYHESAAMDRIRTYRWRGRPVPEEDREEADRQSLIDDGVVRGALRDPELGRAQLRRVHLLESPRAVLDDPDVRARAEATRAHFATKAPTPREVDRDGLLSAIAAAAPTPV